jgi:amidohydrolase
MITTKILETAAEISSKIDGIRQRIHRYPELAYEEVQTSRLIAHTLENIGIPFEVGICETGVIGMIHGNCAVDTSPHRCNAEGNKVVGLRADMDALPIMEKTNRPYSSERSGLMHACGHDGHVAILLGAAMILSRLRHEVNGDVKLIFQPGEEAGDAAGRMINAGVLRDPMVSHIFAVHLWPELAVGQIGVNHGPAMAGAVAFNIRIRGQAGHCGMPHEAIDALAIATQLVNMLQLVVSRQIDPFDPVVLNVGLLRSGYRRNVVAEEAEISGTIRTLKEQTMGRVCRNMEKITAGVCEALGGEYELCYPARVSPTVNDEFCTKIAKSAAQELFGNESIELLRNPNMTAEDFSAYLNVIPGAFIKVGTRDDTKGYIHPLHSPRFDFGVEAMVKGAALLAYIAYKTLEISR